MHSKAEPWPVAAIQHSRLLRPYSPRRLSEALYHVNATAGSIAQAETRLLIDQPADPDDWCYELTELQNELASLAEYCEEASRMLDVLARSAHADYGRALTAMVAILEGMRPGLSVVDGEAPAAQAA